MSNVNQIENVVSFKRALLSAVELRAEFELSKSEDNTSMQKTLSDIHKSVDNDTIATIMMLSSCDANRINKSERVNARLNVYAYEKDVNIARFMSKACALNHYTLAIFKSCIALEKASFVLTHDDASSACSMNCKSKEAKREAILKTTKYAKHVAANTASTQSSSSISALQSFNVLVEMRDASNAVCYKLNREAYATKQIAELLDIAL